MSAIDDLQTGVMTFDADMIENALNNGADVEANLGGMTPLFILLAMTQNVDLPKTLACVKVLLNHNARVETKELEQIVRIGHDFEFYLDSMADGFAEEIEPSLKELYSIFDVEPVPPKRTLGKGEKISLKSKRWQTQHDELWDLLVPGQGQAKTVQGEVIRISGKISYELLDNGGINWDGDFEAMLNELPKLWQKGKSNQAKLDELQKICKGIIAANGDYQDEAEVSRMSELCVDWILQNPEIIELHEKLSYAR